jgi:ATP-binding cassette, subfamily B, bacterial
MESSRRRFSDYRQKLKAHRREPGGRQTAEAPASITERRKGQRQRSFWELLRAFWELAHRYRRRLIACLALLTVGTLLGLLPPLGTKLAIDGVLSDPPQALPSWLDGLLHGWHGMGLLVVIAAAVTVVVGIRTILQLAARWLATTTVQRLQADVRRRVLEHAMELPLHRLQQTKSGGATSILREDAGGVGELVFNLLYTPWSGIIQLIGSLLILTLVDWRLLVGGLLLLPVVYYSHRTWIHRIRPLYRDLRQTRQQIDAAVTECFAGIRIVRSFTREHTEALRYVTSNHLQARQAMMVWWRTRLIEVVWEVLIPIASTGLLLYGGWQILRGELTLGDLMMFLVYLAMLLGPIASLASTATQFQNNLAGLDRILDLLADPPEIPDAPAARSPAVSQGPIGLELIDVSYRYPGAESWTLNAINLRIEAGSTVALVGRSGAGKTTLCNLLARFMDPGRGRVLVDGIDLTNLRRRDYRRLLAMVEQDVFLFDGSVLENIRYGKRGATLEQVQAAAEAAAADEFIAAMPAGYATLIGERGVKLSGGQRQRLAIARAILADPQLLLLDEATSNLDSESELKIQASLSRLLENRTSVVIAHRLSTIRRADLIVVLDHGEVVQSGTHEQLMRSEGWYRRMVDQQQLGLPASIG